MDLIKQMPVDWPLHSMGRSISPSTSRRLSQNRFPVQAKPVDPVEVVRRGLRTCGSEVLPMFGGGCGRCGHDLCQNLD